MNSNYIIFVLIILLTSSCTKSKIEEDLSDFSKYHLVEKKGALADSILLGRPGSITLINDWLAVCDIYDGNMVTWISPDMKTHKRNVSIGVGPGEFLPPISIYPKNNGSDVSLMLRSTSTCYTFSWEDIISECFTNPIRVDSLPKIAGKIIPCGAYYVLNDLQNDNKLFSMLSSNGQNICRFGEYPGTIEVNTDNQMARNMITQSMMAYNDNHRTMVAAGYMSDMLSFYRIEDDCPKLIKEYFSINADISVKENKNGIKLAPTDKSLSTYIELYATDSYLYALYWGTSYGKLPPQNYIRIFDWNGNFVKGLIINDILTSIAVDEKKNILYGISRVEETTINIYPLDIDNI